jgi:hypothetical protein
VNIQSRPGRCKHREKVREHGNIEESFSVFVRGTSLWCVLKL